MKLTATQIGMAVLGVAVVAVGAVAVFGNPLNNAGDGQSPMEALTGRSVSQDEGAFSMSFVDMIRLGQNFQCTFTVDEDGTVTDGIVYVAESGDRFRGEFDIKQPGEPDVMSYVVRDGEYNYIWGVGGGMEAGQGIKMRFDPADDELFFGEGWNDFEEDGAGSGSSNAFFDETAEVDFDCQRWSVDQTKFIPPTDINFMDFSVQMELFQEAMQSGGMPTQGFDMPGRGY